MLAPKTNIKDEILVGFSWLVCWELPALPVPVPSVTPRYQCLQGRWDQPALGGGKGRISPKGWSLSLLLVCCRLFCSKKQGLEAS